MPCRRLALAVSVVAVVLAGAGCTQPRTALDSPNRQQDERTVTPPTVLRTPVRVPSAPATVAPPEGQSQPGPEGGDTEQAS